MSQEIRLLKLPEVKRITGLSRSSIYIRISMGTFPTPIRFAVNSVAWKSDEIQEWIVMMVEKTRGKDIKKAYKDVGRPKKVQAGDTAK